MLIQKKDIAWHAKGYTGVSVTSRDCQTCWGKPQPIGIVMKLIFLTLFILFISIKSFQLDLIGETPGTSC